MKAKEQKAQSQIESNNRRGKTGVIISHYIRISGSKCNKGGIIAPRARVKSPRLAHGDGLPWRGSSLEDVLFPH